MFDNIIGILGEKGAGRTEYCDDLGARESGKLFKSLWSKIECLCTIHAQTN